MPVKGPQVGQRGFTIKQRFVDENGDVIDISAATTRTIYLKKPRSKVVVTNSASFTTDGTDGYQEYTTTAITELDEKGSYEHQGYATDGTTDWWTEVKSFPVHANLV